jgi:hypothetical protein|nr:MAG TPA: hypothetical protein [Caudoviricetes sp.]
MQQPTKKDKARFYVQRSQSKYRKDKNGNPIGWTLTFEQWWEIWQESGHYHERGCYRGQYVMARFDDVGPYSPENVKICTCSENVGEGNTWAKRRRKRTKH